MIPRVRAGGEHVVPGAAGSVGSSLGGLIAAISGIAPHVLHHAGPLAGTAILVGAGGTILFGVAGFALSIPMLLRLRRRFGLQSSSRAQRQHRRPFRPATKTTIRKRPLRMDAGRRTNWWGAADHPRLDGHRAAIHTALRHLPHAALRRGVHTYELRSGVQRHASRSQPSHRRMTRCRRLRTRTGWRSWNWSR